MVAQGSSSNVEEEKAQQDISDYVSGAKDLVSGTLTANSLIRF